jgi:hypothetical protein
MIITILSIIMVMCYICTHNEKKKFFLRTNLEVVKQLEFCYIHIGEVPEGIKEGYPTVRFQFCF